MRVRLQYAGHVHLLGWCRVHVLLLLSDMEISWLRRHAMLCYVFCFRLLRDVILSHVIVILSYAFRFADDMWFIPSIKGAMRWNSSPFEIRQQHYAEYRAKLPRYPEDTDRPLPAQEWHEPLDCLTGTLSYLTPRALRLKITPRPGAYIHSGRKTKHKYWSRN
jgi:hypothetical protein